VIGDSSAEALQVPVEERFWKITENDLQTCAASTGKKIEVINFGVSGYGTAQELITLRQYVLGLRSRHRAARCHNQQ